MAFSSSSVSIGYSTKKSDYDRLLDNTKALKDEAINLSGIKTFQSGTVFEIKPKADGIQTRSATGSVSIECEYVSSAGNSVVSLKTKVIEIGDWNMDSNSGLVISHGLADYTKIRKISIIIRRDDGDLSMWENYSSLSTEAFTPSVHIDSTNITMTHDSSGYFDSAAYDSTSYNRGWITILYEG